MTPESIVIVGGGASAHTFLRDFRSAGGDAEVVILSADDHAPCFRPYLTKDFLAGEIGADKLPLEDIEWYRELDADLRLRSPVTGIDVGGKMVHTAEGPVPYDTLVVATGSSSSRLDVPGGDRPELLTIRSIADSERVVAEVSDGSPTAVIGTGFIGCEAAASLRARGVDVTMIGMEQSPQIERLGPVPGRWIEGWLRDIGVNLMLGADVQAFEYEHDSIVTRVKGGLAVESAHVLVATGARPNVELGPTVHGGIPVDASMRTAVPQVFAIGDIAFAHNESARRALRVEHWGDAEAMGSIAGAVAAGHDARWDAVPGFWSTIAGHEMKYVAWGDGWDDFRVHSDQDSLVVWYAREGELVGTLTYNRDDAYEEAQDLIRRRVEFATL